MPAPRQWLWFVGLWAAGVGVTALVTGDTRIGMLSIIVLFAGGAILLARARRAE